MFWRSLVKGKRVIYRPLQLIYNVCISLRFLICSCLVLKWSSCRFADKRYLGECMALHCFLKLISCLCSSYGSVYKAIHKESGQVVAIKQVPVESDLQEIIKEISIMQQCDR